MSAYHTLLHQTLPFSFVEVLASDDHELGRSGIRARLLETEMELGPLLTGRNEKERRLLSGMRMAPDTHCFTRVRMYE